MIGYLEILPHALNTSACELSEARALVQTAACRSSALQHFPQVISFLMCVSVMSAVQVNDFHS